MSIPLFFEYTVVVLLKLFLFTKYLFFIEKEFIVCIKILLLFFCVKRISEDLVSKILLVNIALFKITKKQHHCYFKVSNSCKI